MTENEALKLMENLQIDSKCNLIETLAFKATVINALEKQVPKKPKHTKIQYGKHKWKRKENGEVDDFAWASGYCNGVVCEVCHDSYCVHCTPNYDEQEDCEDEYYNCPSCDKKFRLKKKYCDCGQKLDWEEV